MRSHDQITYSRLSITLDHLSGMVSLDIWHHAPDGRILSAERLASLGLDDALDRLLVEADQEWRRG